MGGGGGLGPPPAQMISAPSPTPPPESADFLSFRDNLCPIPAFQLLHLFFFSFLRQNFHACLLLCCVTNEALGDFRWLIQASTLSCLTVGQ